MQGGFVKFRKKQARIALINSLVWGIAAAMLAVGAFLLFSKLSKKSLHILVYALVPVCAFGIAACACYFLSRQKDKKLAKRLDEEFALNDRVQTMIEFQDKQTDMIRLQREDAQARLQDVPDSRFKWKGLWACLAALVCAAAVLLTGVLLPKRETFDGNNVPPPPPRIEFEITDDQKTKLATLIKNVKESKAEDGVKTAIVTELEMLLVSINENEIETATKLYQEIADIITVIDGFVETHNTYKRVYGAIRASEMEAVQLFAIGIGLNDLPTTRDALNTALQPEEKDSVLALAAITEFVTELKTRFAEVKESAQDGLMIAMAELLEDFETVTALDPAIHSHDKMFESFDKAINDNVKALTTALQQQADNRTVTNDAIQALISIFKIPADQIPEWGGSALEGLDGVGNTPEEPPQHGDGIIIDGILYPSNETVYDYYTKVICEYGKVFEGDAYNYKAAINSLIAEGVTDGSISPEVEKMLRAYLDALSGSKVDGGEN